VGVNIAIDDNVSAIENFIRLNKINGNRWRTVPFTPVEQPFILFSELDLVQIFWSNPVLKSWLSELVLFEDGTKPALGDIEGWLSAQGPGQIISRLLTDIGRVEDGDPKGKSSALRKSKAMRKRRHRKGPRAFNAITMDQRAMRRHLSKLREPDFDPRSYTDKGYTLYGSIRTDGFRLQLLSFKLGELKSVRYRRLPDEVLPDRMTSTVGGVDYYLTEIRNVVKSMDDVTRLWGCNPEDVQIIGLDLGQTCVVGASAILPNGGPGKRGNNEGRTPVDADGDVQMEGPHKDAKPEKFYNFVVTQKALYQSILKNRRWIEKEKMKAGPNDTESIVDIESNLPPRTGEDSDVLKYLECLDRAITILDRFYNGNHHRFKRRGWDARKAFEAEFAVITDRILSVVGGSVSRKREDSCKVVIALGLGKFSSKTKLTSLHAAFMSYFVRKVTPFDHERDTGGSAIKS